MQLESKYNIGDRIHVARYKSTTTHVPCPDCLGNGKWEVKNPAGKDVIVDCPNCNEYYGSTGRISEAKVTPYTETLTIGLVNYDSEYDWETKEYKQYFKYMCTETGIGSGSVWREDKVFDNIEEAMLATVEEAARVQEQMDKTNAEQEAKRRRQLKSRGCCEHCEGTGKKLRRSKK